MIERVGKSDKIDTGYAVGERFWFKYKGEMWCCIVTRDNYSMVEGIDDWRWHISLSMERQVEAGEHDVPVWRDFVAIVHHLRPGVPFVIGIPPQNMWMNLNPNVLHAYETKDEAMVENWRIQSEAARARGDGSHVPT